MASPGPRPVPKTLPRWAIAKTRPITKLRSVAKALTRRPITKRLSTKLRSIAKALTRRTPSPSPNVFRDERSPKLGLSPNFGRSPKRLRTKLRPVTKVLRGGRSPKLGLSPNFGRSPTASAAASPQNSSAPDALTIAKCLARWPVAKRLPTKSRLLAKLPRRNPSALIFSSGTSASLTSPLSAAAAGRFFLPRLIEARLSFSPYD